MPKQIYLALAALLLLCLAPMPYGYYQLVRFVAMVAFGIMMYRYYVNDKAIAAVVFGVQALLFQPIFKIALGRTTWNVNDVLVVVLLIGLFVLEKGIEKKAAFFYHLLNKAMKKNFLIFFLCSCSMLLMYGCKSEIKLSGNDSVLTEIDLGLSIEWANMNLGAESPEEFGQYYVLGDVRPYDSIPNTINLPANQEEWLDSLSVVLPNFDAASYHTDNNWRIPTVDEWIELCEKCEWRWASYNEVEGYHIVGPNGNSIFLPAAGNTESKYGDAPNGAYRSSFIFDGGATYNIHFIKPKNGTTPEKSLEDFENADVWFDCYGCHVPISIRPVSARKNSLNQLRK